ncbi:MAG TPA: phytanoyl-CoA dioxygenase family protein [Mucilaginibacter sp.]
MKTGKVEAGKALFKAMLEKEGFSDDEVALRFKNASSPDYWRKLNPQLNICEGLNFDNFEENPFSQEDTDKLLHQLKYEGYFSSGHSLISDEITSRMLLAVENLRNAGWHEVWAFVYDEFWQVTRTPSMHRLLSGHLGNKYMALPHVVVHYVHPETGAGWNPHIDFSDRDDRFTVWFPISDSTLDNGCMYVVAKNRIPAALIQKFVHANDLTCQEVRALLHNTKALPVPAGSMLGWEGDVVHWGATSTKETQPRVSLSVVYVKENIDPLPDEIPLLLPTQIPDYPTRMISIAKAIRYYKIHVLTLKKFDGIAKLVIDTFKEEVLLKYQ